MTIHYHLEGVIFDVDGVLCDSERFICQAAMDMFAARHNVRVRPEDFIPFVGAGENRYLGGVANKYRVRLDLESDKKYTYDRYLEIIRGNLPPLPGVHDFLSECRLRKLRIAVATSADLVKLEANLREIGLSPGTFDACVNGLEVIRKKPAPDIFRLAARRLGIPAKACLVVEDAPNGVRAAKAAGAACLGLTTSFDSETLLSAGADFTAPHLAAAPLSIFSSL